MTLGQSFLGGSCFFTQLEFKLYVSSLWSRGCPRGALKTPPRESLQTPFPRFQQGRGAVFRSRNTRISFLGPIRRAQCCRSAADALPQCTALQWSVCNVPERLDDGSECGGALITGDESVHVRRAAVQGRAPAGALFSQCEKSELELSPTLLKLSMVHVVLDGAH